MHTVQSLLRKKYNILMNVVIHTSYMISFLHYLKHLPIITVIMHKECSNDTYIYLALV